MSAITATNRIDRLFQEKKSGILSMYFTAGFPSLHDTNLIINALEKAGADIIEIGIPFSDPVADGPTIQESNQKALDNGMTLHLLFEQLKDLRNSVQVPVVLMGYLNPVLQFGIEAFCARCQEVGVDGVILPDLPAQEYLDEYRATFERYGLRNTFLITPQTSEKRVRMIDQATSGFIYMVSSASTTGAKSTVTDDQLRYFDRIRKMHLTNPTLIGFGISDNATYSRACQYASGAIIGSAFIKVLSQSTDLEKDIIGFVRNVKGN